MFLKIPRGIPWGIPPEDPRGVHRGVPCMGSTRRSPRVSRDPPGGSRGSPAGIPGRTPRAPGLFSRPLAGDNGTEPCLRGSKGGSSSSRNGRGCSKLEPTGHSCTPSEDICVQMVCPMYFGQMHCARFLVDDFPQRPGRGTYMCSTKRARCICPKKVGQTIRTAMSSMGCDCGQ